MSVTVAFRSALSRPFCLLRVLMSVAAILAAGCSRGRDMRPVTLPELSRIDAPVQAQVHERYDVQLKGEFINIFNHANTLLNLGGSNDVSSYTDVLAYKSGNRNTELSLHLAF
jgi:hypothetical protein